MRRPIGLVSVLVATTLALAGCSGSTPAPAPAPSAIPLRTVAPCPASVVVPTETVTAAPSADAPPTVVVQVGDAISFPVPRGARIGISGDADAAEDAGVCSAPVTTGDVTWVAQTVGYLRIATQVGIQPAERFFLRVTV